VAIPGTARTAALSRANSQAATLDARERGNCASSAPETPLTGSDRKVLVWRHIFFANAHLNP
jgi:hypothetical protein